MQSCWCEDEKELLRGRISDCASGMQCCCLEILFFCIFWTRTKLQHLCTQIRFHVKNSPFYFRFHMFIQKNGMFTSTVSHNIRLLPSVNEVAGRLCFQSCLSVILSYHTTYPALVPPCSTLAPAPQRYVQTCSTWTSLQNAPLHVQTCSFWSTYGWQTGSWYPTGMLSCMNWLYVWSLCDSQYHFGKVSCEMGS